MEILILLILLIVIGFEVYFMKTIEKIKKEEEPVVIPKQEEDIDDIQAKRREELQKREKLKKSFDSLFSYDYETALKKKEE